MTKYINFFLTIILSTLLSSYTVTAKVITLEYKGFAQGSVNVNQTLDGNSRNAAAGMFDLNVLTSDVPWINPNTSVQAFCIELDQFIITDSPIEYTLQSGDQFFNSPAQAEFIGRLYTTALESVISQTTSENQRLFSSAFQLAMWELVYDFDAIDLLDNRFVTDSRSSRNNIRTIANSWLTGLSGVSNNFSISVLQSDASQDLIVAKENEIPVSTPSVALIVLASLLLLGWRFKR